MAAAAGMIYISAQSGWFEHGRRPGTRVDSASDDPGKRENEEAVPLCFAVADREGNAQRSDVKAPVIATLALLAGLVWPAHAAVEFAGYLRMGEEMKFLLTDPATDKKSDWLARGGSFDGYTVVDFDAKKEVLLVEKAGTAAALPLKLPGTQLPSPAGSASPAAPAPTYTGQTTIQGGRLNIEPPVAAGNKAELTLQLARAKAQQVVLRERYKDAHPEIGALQARIAEIEKELGRLPP